MAVLGHKILNVLLVQPANISSVEPANVLLLVQNTLRTTTQMAAHVKPVTVCVLRVPDQKASTATPVLQARKK